MAISRMPAKVDIWSRGEVAAFLVELEKAGQIKPCKHLMLEHGHASAFYPRCKKEWASRVTARNVPIDITAYSGPSSYSWPKCPEDCPHFLQAENFLVSVSRDQYSPEETDPPPPQVEEPLAMPVVPLPANSAKADLSVPTHVTLRWLFQHVPIGLWISAVALLCAVFVAGVQSSRLSFVREVIGLTGAPPVASTAPSVVAKAEPNPSLKGTAAGKPASAP
jgi:hypothetical protein